MIQSLSHHVSRWRKSYSMIVYGFQWNCLVFIDDVTADRAIGLNSEVYGAGAVISAHIQPICSADRK